MSMSGCHSTIRAAGRVSQGSSAGIPLSASLWYPQEAAARVSWRHPRKHLNSTETLEWQTWKAWIQKGAMHLPLLLKTFGAPSGLLSRGE